jgi:hypothetical protein
MLLLALQCPLSAPPRDPTDLLRNLDRRILMKVSWCKLRPQKSRQTEDSQISPPPLPFITFRSGTEIICCRPSNELRNCNKVLKADKTELNCRVVNHVSGSQTPALNRGLLATTLRIIDSRNIKVQSR